MLGGAYDLVLEPLLQIRFAEQNSPSDFHEGNFLSRNHFVNGYRSQSKVACCFFDI